jgi:septum formation protein
MSLILASSSPRRQELLRHANIPFEVRIPEVDETPRPGEVHVAFARRMAREKARYVFRKQPMDVVLAADTIVVVGDEMLGKPVDAADAARMLCLLSGRAHQVITAIYLLGPGLEEVRTETTNVFMTELTEDEILAYVSTLEPMDKAGAYAIQGIASRWVTKIEGCYFNVVGLPVPLLYRTLKEYGLIKN